MTGILYHNFFEAKPVLAGGYAVTHKQTRLGRPIIGTTRLVRVHTDAEAAQHDAAVRNSGLGESYWPKRST